VPSAKRRTTSKSGASGRSTRTETSPRVKPSSATAPASFAQVFGETKAVNPERERARALLTGARLRLAHLQGLPEPRLALLRQRHRARLDRMAKYVRDLEEYLATELME